MAATARTIRAAEAVERGRQMRQALDERAFVAGERDPGAEDDASLRQLIDVPVDFLAAPHVAGEAGPQAAGTLGRTAIEVTTRRQIGAAFPGHDAERSVDVDEERISARRIRRLGRVADEAVHPSVSIPIARFDRRRRRTVAMIEVRGPVSRLERSATRTAPHAERMSRLSVLPWSRLQNFLMSTPF
jgi:hypothetical protein